MKLRIIVLSVGVLSAFSSLAVTNQELMDRLDDIEFDQQMREMDREMDKLLLQQLRNQKNSSTNRMGCEQGFYKIIYKNASDGIRACIFKDSIVMNADKTISIMYLVESDKPSYYQNFTYYHSKLYSEIDCSKRMIRAYVAELQDSQFKKVTSFPILFSKFESYGKIGPFLHNYVCK